MAGPLVDVCENSVCFLGDFSGEYICLVCECFCLWHCYYCCGLGLIWMSQNRWCRLYWGEFTWYQNGCCFIVVVGSGILEYLVLMQILVVECGWAPV